MINIEEHRRFVYKLLKGHGIPSHIIDDTYQDFCLYYYSRERNYNPEYAVTTFIKVVFKSFLYERAVRFGAKKRGEEINLYEDTPEQGYEEDLEAKLDMQRLYPKLPALFKILWDSPKTPAIIAKEEGVTRQAIEAKLKRLMAEATEDYREDYA